MRRCLERGLTAALLVLGLQSSAEVPEPAGYLGSYRWTMADDRFGGMSGLVLSPDGMDFLALSDRQNFFAGRLERDAAGRITGVADVTITRITGRNGERLRRRSVDSEGLALGPDGQLWMSMEHPAQIARFRTPEGGGRLIEVPDSFADFDRNASLEAVAVDALGRVYTIPEDTPDETSDFPVWRRDEAGWAIVGAVPRQGGFLVTDAAIGPDGRLYVLERAFHGIFGFQSRLSRFAVGAGVGAQEVLILSQLGQHGNLEGLALRRDGTGLIATMISDNNFRFYQRTEFVEYRLPG